MDIALTGQHIGLDIALKQQFCLYVMAAILVLLDLSAAFDTIDHQVLVQRLRVRCGVTCQAEKWFASNLAHGQQVIQVWQQQSDVRTLHCGVPQGSVLEPLLLISYTSPIGDIA